MAVGFPPQPVYPRAFDSDRTLFLVYNTSEARLSADNAAWAEEVEIFPVGASDPEIWSDNGFANIDGELFYYDSVEKDANEKVYKLKRCARNIGGSQTKFNEASTPPVPGDPETKKGIWVRGYVIAEHHNQIVDAIIASEIFILDVDDRIDILASEPTCVDDAYCVDVDFDFEVTSENETSCEGTDTSYEITITGLYNSFRLDFGDGIFTNSDLIGTHTYPPNSTLDPIITVTSNTCTVVQTPGIRNEAAEPSPEEESPAFEIPIPPAPDFPDIEIPDCDVPIPTLEFPQIVFPCLEIPDIQIPDIDINIPSVIVITPSVIVVDIPSIVVDIPTTITVIGDIPSNISIIGDIPSIITLIGDLPSVISLIGLSPSTISLLADFPSTISLLADFPSTISLLVDFPSTISLLADIPSTISLLADIPSTISLESNFNISIITVSWEAPPSIDDVGWETTPVIADIGWETTPSIADIGWDATPVIADVSWAAPPDLTVSWGAPPTISCDCTFTVSVECGSAAAFGASAAATNAARNLMGEEFIDESFDELYQPAARVDDAKVDMDLTGLGIPSEIKIIAPTLPKIKIDHNLPTAIHLDVPEIPDVQMKWTGPPLPRQIDIVAESIPRQIELVARDVPDAIKLDASSVPDVIRVAATKDFPSVLTVDGSGIPEFIQVRGIPDSIDVNIPAEIVARLEMPENLEIPLVYKGGPVPIQFDTSNLLGDNEEQPCFALVPCNPKK